MTAHQIYHNESLILISFIQETVNYVLHSVISVQYCKPISFLAVWANYCCKRVSWCDFSKLQCTEILLHVVAQYEDLRWNRPPGFSRESRVKCWQNAHVWLLSLQHLLGFFLPANNTERAIIKWYFTTRMNLRWCFLLEECGCQQVV